MCNQDKVLVCVTGQKSCGRLIEKGAALAKEKGAALYVLHVTGQDAPLLGSASDSEALNYLYQLSGSVGAEMTVKRSKNALHAIADYANQIACSDIVLGAAPNAAAQNSFNHRLQSTLKDMRLHVIFE